MPVAELFRLSFFTTLGTACMALSVSEFFFMRWIPAFLLAILGVLAVAWKSRERWQLSAQAANYLGLFLGLAMLGWILLQLPRTEEEFVAAGVNYPAGLLPHLGPVLMVLLCVKIFRPMTLNDFWVLQTIGLMMVTLGCVLADELAFGASAIVYLASLLWCLRLFQQVRELRGGDFVDSQSPLFLPPNTVPTEGSPSAHAPAETPAATELATPSNLRWFGIPAALRWSAAVVILAFTVFVLTPRAGGLQWEPRRLGSGTTRVRMSTGADPGIDLNRVGRIELSTEPAFHVTVSDLDGSPASLSPTQRWRCQILDLYDRGHWATIGEAMEKERAPELRVAPILPRIPEENRKDYRDIHFRLRPVDAGGLAVAEPIESDYLGIDATINQRTPKMGLFFRVVGSDTLSTYQPVVNGTYRYRQIIRSTLADNPPWTDPRSRRYVQYLLKQGVPDEIVPFSRELAERKSSRTASLQDGERRLFEAKDHEAVARALSRHLAGSGEYLYSLDLKRSNRKMDATADFLLNVKSGHCERYAGSLCLMLRAVGIPARVVKGYRGLEETETHGTYVVRQDSAHSWVQALLTDREPWQWITLDPTPGFEDPSASGFDLWRWMAESMPDPVMLWREWVMRMSGETQLDFYHSIWLVISGNLGLVGGVFAVAACLAIGFWTWPLLRNARKRNEPANLLGAGSADAPVPDFYSRWLLAVQKRLSLRPKPHETPMEFASLLSKRFEETPELQNWQDRPVAVASEYYRMRFGAAGSQSMQDEICSWSEALSAKP